MTCLISGFTTKQQLKQAVAQGLDPYIHDPSIFNPFSGKASDYIRETGNSSFAVCLDHPKRLKFALIKMSTTGLKVE